MSPFSHFLRRIRMRRQVRQSELADLLGYDQTYISALEIGAKGPPTPEFIERLATTLSLTASEEAELNEAATASQRKFVLDLDTPEDLYWLFKDLRDEWDRLSPPQVQIIRATLKMGANRAEPAAEEPLRLRRRTREQATM
jgi:transcriptional regulator with XRE-family HTH domain